MPYVEQYRRQKLDQIVELMEDAGIVANGDLNYILYKFAMKKCNSYNTYKNYLGELAEVSAEIRRRLLAPYEETKIISNGDVI